MEQQQEKEKILIVDDESTLRLALKARLAAGGFQTDTAVDGVEAMEKLKQDRFDVVLLNIKMPRIDGIQVLHHILENYPDTEVMMMTGFSDFTTAIDCLKRGAKDYLVKPIEPTELITRVRSLLRARTSERALKALQQEHMSLFFHDLLGPLGTIESTIDHLADDPLATYSEEQSILLHYIAEISSRMEKRLRDMIDLTKFEAGQIKLEYRSVDILTLSETTSLRYEILSKIRGISYVKKIPDHLPEVKCDYDRISQALNNLLDNATKFTPSAGTITLSIEHRSTDGEDGILFSVEDTGIGIPESELPKIFDRYKEYLLKKSVSQKKAAIGLAITKHIVESHHGRIWVESKEGKGSKFSFILPIKN